MSKAVLIVDMPKSCDACDFAKMINGKMYCSVPGNSEIVEDYIERRSVNCPLQEVSDIERIKFENLVMFLAKESFEGDMQEEIETFEEKIEETGCGKAYFGTARSDWDRIDIINPPYSKGSTKFYAEYYDGFQAPFLVCEWGDDFEKMENLLKTTDSTLYKKYQEYLADLN